MIDVMIFEGNKYICVYYVSQRGMGASVVVRLASIVYNISFSRLES